MSMLYVCDSRYRARSNGSDRVLYALFSSEDSARDLECDVAEAVYLSGWCCDWSCRNSRLSKASGMVKGPEGGGPEGRVEGKSV